MTKVIVDPATQAKLANVQQTLELAQCFRSKSDHESFQPHRSAAERKSRGRRRIQTRRPAHFVRTSTWRDLSRAIKRSTGLRFARLEISHVQRSITGADNADYRNKRVLVKSR